jgi:hypothetical protein
MDLHTERLIAERETQRWKAEKKYRVITKYMDTNVLLDTDGDQYWDGYYALATYAANFEGIEDCVLEPFPADRRRPNPKPKPKVMVIPTRYRPRRARWLAVGVAIALGVFVIKPALDSNPCPSGTSLEATGFQNLCVNQAGDTVRILATYGP